MAALIGRRLMQLPVIVLVVYTLTFCLAWLIPGNPLENPEGRRPLPEIEEAMKKVKEAQSLVSATVDPLMGLLNKRSR